MIWSYKKPSVVIRFQICIFDILNTAISLLGTVNLKL